MDTVWHQVDRELTRRGKPWRWLAIEIGETEQTVNNWKRRGVPPRQHAAIAAALGWSIDRLLGIAAPYQAAPPPTPPKDFSDRHEVPDDDWALFQDIKDAMASPKLARQVAEIREEVSSMRAIAEEMFRRRMEASEARGGNAGGMSAFGDLTDERGQKPEVDPKQKRK